MRPNLSSSLNSSVDSVADRHVPLLLRYRALAALVVIAVAGSIVVFASPDSPRRLATMIDGTSAGCAANCYLGALPVTPAGGSAALPVTSPPSAWWGSSVTVIPSAALHPRPVPQRGSPLGSASTRGVSAAATPRKANPAKAALLADADVKAALADVMLVLSMSPARYRLAPLVREHYAAFFTHMIFIGPVGDRNTSVEIHEHDTFYGNGQYRAMASVMRQVEGTAAAAGLAGYLYLADDLVLQPWTLVGLNKTVPWASMIGVANLFTSRTVKATQGMSIEPEFRKMPWIQWRKNRARLGKVLDGPMGPIIRPGLARAFNSTNGFLRRTSGYRRRGSPSAEELRNFVFFTIADTYYVPRSIALPFAEVCDAMAAKIVHGELAIPTALRALSPTYEALSVQYYWAEKNASQCPRRFWRPEAAGVHRCAHDHPFASALFNATSRRRLVDDPAYRADMLRVNPDGRLPPPNRPTRPSPPTSATDLEVYGKAHDP